MTTAKLPSRVETLQDRVGALEALPARVEVSSAHLWAYRTIQGTLVLLGGPR